MDAALVAEGNQAHVVLLICSIQVRMHGSKIAWGVIGAAERRAMIVPQLWRGGAEMSGMKRARYFIYARRIMPSRRCARGRGWRCAERRACGLRLAAPAAAGGRGPAGAPAAHQGKPGPHAGRPRS